MQNTTTISAEQANAIQNPVKSKNGRGKAKRSGCFLKAIYKFQTSFADGITADNLFDARTEKIICSQADSLVCTGLFPQYEREDIQQTLRLALLHEMSNFTAGGDRYTFAANVACNYGKNLIAKRAKEREATNGAILSLDVPMPDGETFGELLEDEEEISPAENAIRQEAIASLLSRLDGVDLKICQKFLEGKSIHEMEHDKDVNMTCASIRYRLRNTIRPVAIECGLGRFLGQGGDAE